MTHKTVLLGALLVASMVALGASETPERARPNILIITADNLGYGDLPCFHPGSPIIAPNLGRMAAQGVKLTSFYTASPTCTVSRACLLTGRVAQRHGLMFQLSGIEGNYGRGLDPAEILLPQILQTAGYATGCFGKWNIGFARGSRPLQRGFDVFLGHASGNIDYYRHIYNGKHDLFQGNEELHANGKYSTDLFADAAIDFIRRKSALHSPWFCYLPLNAPHYPNAKNKRPGQPVIWQAPDRAFRAYGLASDEPDPKKRYRAVVTALDEAIGRVLRALDALSVADDTFVFFYSDNGAFMLKDRGLEVASNAPLRDGGTTCWEGGIRVAALARWPGMIPAGSTVDAPLWSPDLMTVCAKIAGAPLPPDRVLDGRDPLPVLTAQTKTSAHPSLYFCYQRHAALRMGDWKIVRTQPDSPWRLFDLSRDVGERNDLAAQQPEKLRQLVAELARWETTR